MKLRLASLLPIAVAVVSSPLYGQTTWNGSTNTDWATAANWSSDPSLPVPGDDIVIANSTTNNIGSLGGEDRVIGSFIFGDAGARDTTFTVNTGTTNSLTIQGGLTASVTGVRPTFQGNVIVDGAQTWAIGGDTATVDLDRGVRLTRSGGSGVGSVTLNGDLTKTGTGSIEFLAITLSGAGNLIVNGGSVKVNAGSSALVTIGGSGNIQLNNDASLVFAKNSGTMSVTRDIVMNGTSSIIWGRGGTDFTTEVASAIQWNGTHNLSRSSTSAGNFEFSGAWTGAGTVTRTGSQTLILSGDNTGFTGHFVHDGAFTGITGPFGGSITVSTGTVTMSHAPAGSVAVNGGTLTVNAEVPGSLTLTSGTVNLNAGLSGTLAAFTGGTFNLGGGTLTGNVTVENGSLSVASGAVVDGNVTTGGIGTSLTLSGSVTGDVSIADDTTVVFDGAQISGNLEVGDATFSETPLPIGNAVDIDGSLKVNGSLVVFVDGTVASGQPILTFSSLVTDTPDPRDSVTVITPAGMTNVVVDFNATSITVTYTMLPVTWIGSTDTSWNNEENWDPGLPAASSAVTIADSTTHDIGSLDGVNRSIGSLTFGDTGTRVTPFTVNTGTNSLAIQSGLTAAGSFTGTGLTLLGNVVLSGNQSWSVGGESGLANLDRGVLLRGTANATPGTVLLDGDLTKTGSGQLYVANTTLTGPGNIVVDEGSFRVNAGFSSLASVGGSGSITVNNDAAFLLARDSGTMVVTRPIIMNDTATLGWGNGSALTVVQSPITWNGTHDLAAQSASTGFEFSGNWSGSGTVTRTGSASVLTLSGQASDFDGQFIVDLASAAGTDRGALLASANALGTGDILVRGRQQFNASLEVANGLTVHNSITLQRGGGNSNRAVLHLGGSAVWAGSITVDNTSNSGVAVINAQGNSEANASIVSGDVSFSELGTGDAVWLRGGQWGKSTGSIHASTGRVVIIDATKWEFNNAFNTWGQLAINNNGAIVTVGSANTLSSTGVVTADGSGTLRLNNQAGTTAFDQTIAGLSSTVNVGLQVGAATLTLNTTANQIHTGSISGNISLIKDGLASQSLGTANISGTVTVNEGTLAGAGSFGDVTVKSGATLAPGAPTGQMNTGKVTLEPGSTLSIRLDSSASSVGLLFVNGEVDLTGATLRLSDVAATPAVLPIDTVFTLIDYGPHPFTGTFSGLPEGSTVAAGPNLYTLSYADDGVVTLTSAGAAPTTGYDDWLIAAGLTPGAPGTGPLESYDRSGVANIVQFGLGGDVLDATDNGVQALFTTDAADNANLVLTIAVRDGATFAGSPSPSATVDGITYSIQGSDTLATFTSQVEEIAVQDGGGTITAPTGYTLKSFRLVQAPALGSLGFLRVGITEP